MSIRPSGTFRPNGAVTGVGGLPFTDPDEACAFVASRCPRVPFSPQTPTSDTAVDLLARSGPGAPDARMFARFALAARLGRFPDAIAYKTQVTGPVTTALLRRRASRVDDTFLATIADRVVSVLADRIALLAPTGLPVIAVVDEPALGVWPGRPPAVVTATIAEVLQHVRAVGGVPGVHACTVRDPARFTDLGADVRSWDASGTLRSPTSAPGGIIAPGLVHGDGGPGGVPGAFSRWLQLAARTGDPVDLAGRTLVTATCGLGRSTPAVTRANFTVAEEVGRLVERVATGTVAGSVPV